MANTFTFASFQDAVGSYWLTRPLSRPETNRNRTKMPITRSMARKGGAAPSAATQLPNVKKRRAPRAQAKPAVIDRPATVALTSRPDSPRTSRAGQPAEIIARNRLLLVELEQNGALAPGVVTVGPTGELKASLERQPDAGTMTGLYPDMAASPDLEDQIPSWLRDYLIRELDVHDKGPPRCCLALYEGLRRSQDDVGVNPSVWVVEMQLSCAAISLRHSVDDVRDFVDCVSVVGETYEREFGVIVRTVLGLVGCVLEEAPREIRLLAEVGGAGASMKGALEEPLMSLVVEPYSRLIERMEVVARALRGDIKCGQARKGDEVGVCDAASVADSGVDICELDVSGFFRGWTVRKTIESSRKMYY